MYVYVYIVLEMADIELISVSAFSDLASAQRYFDVCERENEVQRWGQEDMKNEIVGTMMVAGDDSYSLQLLVREFH